MFRGTPVSDVALAAAATAAAAAGDDDDDDDDDGGGGGGGGGSSSSAGSGDGTGGLTRKVQDVPATEPIHAELITAHRGC
ncbi:hypothetical protein SprV_0100448900 [Sparganum proliferum]